MIRRFCLGVTLLGVSFGTDAACLNGSVGIYNGQLEGLWCQGSCRLLTLNVGAPIVPYTFEHRGAQLDSCDLTVLEPREAVFLDEFRRYDDSVSIESLDGVQTLALDTTQPRPVQVDEAGNVVVYLAGALEAQPYAPPSCPLETVFELSENTAGVNFYPDELCQAAPDGMAIRRNSVDLRVLPLNGGIEPIYQGFRYLPPDSIEYLQFDEILFTIESLDGQQSNVSKIRFNFPAS